MHRQPDGSTDIEPDRRILFFKSSLLAD